MKTIITFAAIVFAVAATGTAFARPESKIACPIMKDEIASTKGKLTSTYKNKTFYFCCGGCKPTFDKMTVKQKDALLKYGVAMPKPSKSKPATPKKSA